MENQEKKAWLKNYRAMGKEVQRTQEEMELWRERAAKITQSYSGLPNSGGGSADTIPKCVAKIIELEKELDDKLDEMLDRRREIERAIQTITNPVRQNIMRLRYIDGKTWERIAEEMNFDTRWVLRLHGRALQDLQIGEKP